MNDLERFGALQGIEISGKEYTGDEGLIRKLFEARKDELVKSAIEAQRDARHYGNTHVGCAILTCLDFAHLEQGKIVTAGNRKHKPGMVAWPKRQCGEMRAIRKALKSGDKFIPAVVTASQKANTGELDKAHNTVIDPCRQCQGMFRVLLEKGVVSLHTQLYNTRVDAFGNVLDHQQLSLGIALENWGKNDKEAIELSLQDLKIAWEDFKARYLLAKILFKVSKEATTPQMIARQEKKVKVEFMGQVMRAVKSALEEGVGIAQISQVFGLSLSSETTVAGLIEQIKQVIDREIAKIDEIVANRPMQS